MATTSRARKSVAAAAAAVIAAMGYAADGVTALPAVSLADVVNATAAGTFLYVKTDAPFMGDAILNGYVETNSTVAGPAGYIATRATEKGANSMTQAQAQAQTQTATDTGAAGTAAAASATASATASAVFFVSEDELPKNRANALSGRSEKYEFATMAAPTTDANGKKQFASFFVAGKKATDMSSTISGANKRYATESKHPDGSPVMRKTRPSKTNPEGQEVPVLILTREFRVRDYTHNGVAGALVSRIA